MIKRHNQVVNTLVKYIRRAGGIAVAEPASLDTKGKKRIDIDAYLGSRHYHIDVRITNPMSDSYTRVARQTLGAAMQAEREKKRKHKSNAERVGAIFVPYIIETYGGVAPEARTLNRIIGRFAEDYRVT